MIEAIIEDERKLKTDDEELIVEGSDEDDDIVTELIDKDED